MKHHPLTMLWILPIAAATLLAVATGCDSDDDDDPKPVATNEVAAASDESRHEDDKQRPAPSCDPARALVGAFSWVPDGPVPPMLTSFQGTGDVYAVFLQLDPTYDTADACGLSGVFVYAGPNGGDEATVTGHAASGARLLLTVDFVDPAKPSLVIASGSPPTPEGCRFGSWSGGGQSGRFVLCKQ